MEIKTKVKTPRPPNFLILENGSCIELSALSDAELVELSKAWLEACRERAEEQRNIFKP